MSIPVLLGQIYVPASVKKKRLTELCTITADAFQCEPLALEGFRFDACLPRYAEFTRDKANAAISEGTGTEAKERLYDGAYAMAHDLKRSFRVESRSDVVRMIRLIYKLLGIDLRIDKDGSVTVRKCFFSRYYSAPVCRVISSLDEGLIEGLSGGRFRFSKRLTEGHDCCRALLSFDGEVR